MSVPYYTLFMLAGFIVAGWMSYHEAKRRSRLDENTLMVGSIGLLGGIVGAKLSMLVFLGPEEFWRLLPTIPFHGAALSGGLAGGYIAIVLSERALGVTRCTGDLVAPFLPLGQAIGRMGNFLAGDAFGSPTSLPWGVYQGGAYRHPAQLYELVLDLALFAFLFRKRLTSFHDGELFRMYAVGYAMIRFPLEFLRYQPTPRDFMGLTLVQWLCIGAFIFFGYQLYVQWKGGNVACHSLPRFRKKEEAQ